MFKLSFINHVLQGMLNFFCKGRGSKYFRLCGPSSLSLSESNLRQNGNEWARLGSNKTLFMDIEIRVSCIFHVSQYILLVGSFSSPNPLRMVEAILSLQAEQKPVEVVFWLLIR